jgi:hypothetical protein
MSLEPRLRAHFEGSVRTLPPAPADLDDVRRRGLRRRRVEQGAITLAALALLAVGVAGYGALARPAIDLSPIAPTVPTTPPATGSPASAAPLELGELGAPVLAFGEEGLRYVDRSEDVEVWPTEVVHAISDGRDLPGVVLQTMAEGVEEIVWLGPGGRERVLAKGQGLQLRGLLPDGRVLYSATPPEVAEDTAEDFYAVAPTEDSEPAPAHLASTWAYESWHVGPAWPATGEPVHAACHLMCSIWHGLAREQDAEPLYAGGAIEGLTTTPDGRLVAFVEFELSPSGAAPVPHLVVLDGATFQQVSRLGLPHEETDAAVAAIVSAGEGGREILVTLGAGSPASGPARPYLVTDAPGPAPQVRPISFDGVVRWADAARWSEPFDAGGADGTPPAGAGS